MDSSNPYAAPKAEVGTTNLTASDLAAAVADIARSSGSLLFLGISGLVMALITVGSSLMVYATAFGAMGNSVLIAMIAMSANIILYAVTGGLLIWLAIAVRKLAGNPSMQHVVKVFDAIARFWMVLAVLLVLPVVSSVAIRFMPVMPPVAGAVIAGLTASSDLVTSAARWRTMIRACIIVGGVMLLLSAASTIAGMYVTPPDLGLMSGTRFWVFGGVIVQVALGALVWRQVPALDAFIATPNAQTLTAVAQAHRTIWRTIAIAAVIVVVLGGLAGVFVTAFFGL